MRDTILIRLACTGDRRDGFASLQTYSRAHGRSVRFLVTMSALRQAVSSDAPVYDADDYSFLCVRAQEAALRFRVTWLSEYAGRCHGYVQSFSIPAADILRLLESEAAETIRHLHRPEPPRARIVTAGAQRSIRNALSDKRTRRALSKAMRDCFAWPGETVYLYSDGGADFYFRTASGFPACGGLILHERAGGGVRYGVHT